MKIEVTDVDSGEMRHFLERIFGEMPIDDKNVDRINSELSEYGYELVWDCSPDCWTIYSR